MAEFSCRICQTPFIDSYPLDEHDLCTVCRESKAGFDASYSYGSYEETLRELIRLFKYSRIETLAKPLGALLLRAIPHSERYDLVMPMPMHWLRRWERGFNQAELLAAPVARRYGLKSSKLLKRVRRTRAQAGLRAAERRDNLKNAFRVSHPEKIAGKRILLVDDVLTTGSTLRAAAAALKAAGAVHVAALTVARVERRISVESGHPLKKRAAASGFSLSDQQFRGGCYGQTGSRS